jgi:hypothetical protein
MKLDFCVACGGKNDLNHHHLMPRAVGGSDDDDNLVTLCRKCHGRVHGALWAPVKERVSKEWKVIDARTKELIFKEVQEWLASGKERGSISAIARKFGVHRRTVDRIRDEKPKDLIVIDKIRSDKDVSDNAVKTGFVVNQKLVDAMLPAPPPPKQSAIRVITDMMNEGVSSTQAMALELNFRKIPCKGAFGGQWNSTAVKRLVEAVCHQ